MISGSLKFHVANHVHRNVILIYFNKYDKTSAVAVFKNILNRTSFWVLVFLLILKPVLVFKKDIISDSASYKKGIKTILC